MSKSKRLSESPELPKVNSYRQSEMKRFENQKMHKLISDWSFVQKGTKRYLVITAQKKEDGPKFVLSAELLTNDNTMYVLRQVTRMMLPHRWNHHWKQIKKAKSWRDMPITQEDTVLFDWKRPVPSLSSSDEFLHMPFE